MYYRNTDRGGGAVIISNDGATLFADPFFVQYEEHVRDPAPKGTGLVIPRLRLGYEPIL